MTLNLVLQSMVILIGISFLFGWNMGALNQPSAHIQDFFKEAYKDRNGKEASNLTVTILWSVTNAVFYPAGMVGALASSLLADRVGRKRAIMISHLPTFVGAVMQTLCVPTKRPELLMVGRFMQGISCGTPDLWHYILLLSVVPALISLIILPMFPESPRYLMFVKNDEFEAYRALTFLRKKADVSDEIEEIKQESIDKVGRSKVTIGMLLTTSRLRKPLLVACSLQMAQQFTGIQAILFYSVKVFTVAGVPESGIEYVVLGQVAVLVFMTAAGALLMDKVGRRPLLIVPLAIIILDLAVFTAALRLQEQHENLSYLSIASALIFVGAFAVGLGPIPLMIGSELFRQGPRPLAMALAGVTNWFMLFAVVFSFELLQTVLKEFTLLIFLFASMFWIVYVYFKVPETKHRTIEHIARTFQSKEDVDDEN